MFKKISNLFKQNKNNELLEAILSSDERKAISLLENTNYIFTNDCLHTIILLSNNDIITNLCDKLSPDGYIIYNALSKYDKLKKLCKRMNLNVINELDWTPLMYACKNNELKTVKLLVKYGADINFVNKNDVDVFWCASRNVHKNEITKYLKKQVNKKYKKYLKQYFCNDIAGYITKYC